MIRPATLADAPQLCEVYNHYVRTTIVTFEEQPVSDIEMEQRIADVTAGLLWLVAETEGAIAGYAYATPWRTRSAYRFSVESTVYLSPSFTGRGLGTELYRALIAALRSRPIHSVIGGIALPNDSSIALHEKLGFTKIGHFQEVGWKLGRWVDVGYWQLTLSDAMR